MKKKKKKIGLIIVAVVMVMIIGIVMVSCSLASAEVGAVVTTTVATRGDLQESISTSGRVESEEVKVLFAPINGKVAEVTVAAGDAVTEGDVMVLFDMEEAEKDWTQVSLQQQKTEAGYQSVLADDAENQAKLKEANTNLAVLNQQIADNEAYLKDAQSKLQNSQRATVNHLAAENYNLTTEMAQLENELKTMDSAADPEGYAAKLARLQEISNQLSRNQYVSSVAGTSDSVANMQDDIAKVQERLAGYEEYKARMESQKTASEAAVLDKYDRTQMDIDRKLAQISYEESEKDYSIAKQGICAAFDGVVTACNIVEGVTIAEGTQMLTLENSEKVKITMKVSKQDLEKIQIGQKAEITVSGHTYEGEVHKINRMATLNESNTPMVGVEIHILNPDDNIILGMDAKLEIYARKAEDALLIPVEAINADRDGDFLFVVENGVIVRQPIVCGISTDTYTQVIEGITEEDQIVLTAYTEVEEGMAVTVMPQMEGVNPTDMPQIQVEIQ